MNYFKLINISMEVLVLGSIKDVSSVCPKYNSLLDVFPGEFIFTRIL